MSQIALRPAASPLDVFAAPETRGGDAGSGLIQLGSALAQFNRNLDYYTRERFRVEQQSELAAGAAAATRFRNQSELKAAVSRGELPEASNPWYMVGLKQQLGVAEVRNLAGSLSLEYEKTPELRNTDNPAEVEGWMRGRLAEALKDRSPLELEAMVPEVQNLSASFAHKHNTRREEERRVTREVIATDNMRGAIRNTPERYEVGPDGEKVPIAESMTSIASQIQGQLDELTVSVNDVDAAKWAVAAVLNEAESMGDAALGRELLSRIKDPTTGKPLGEVGWVRSALDDTNKRITDEKIQEVRRGQVYQREAEEQQINALQSLYWERLKAARQQNPQATVFDVTITVDELEQALPGARANFEAWLHTQRSQESQEQDRVYLDEKRRTQKTLEAQQVQLLAAARTGDVPASLNIIEAMIANGGGGEVSTTLNIVDDIQRGSTTMDALKDLSEKRLNGTLTIKDVVDWGSRRQLSIIDASRFAEDAFRMGTGRVSDSNDSVQLRVATLASSLEAAYETLTETAEGDASLVRLAEIASTSYKKAALDMLRQNPEMPPEQIETKLDELLEKTIAKFGGLPSDQIIQHNLKKIQELRARSLQEEGAVKMSAAEKTLDDRLLTSGGDSRAIAALAKEYAQQYGWTPEQATEWARKQKKLMDKSRMAKQGYPSD